MTVQEASHVLIEWFKDNDYFDLESNYTNVVRGKNLHKDAKLVRSSLLAALENIEEAGIVKSAVPATNYQKIWILQRKLCDLDQTVELSGNICRGIYDFLNECAKNLDMECSTDPLNISQADIESLLWALNILKEAQKND